MTRVRTMDRGHGQRVAALFATMLPLALALTTPAACDAAKTSAPSSQQAPAAPPSSPSPTPASTPVTPPAEKREEAKASEPAPTPAKPPETKVADAKPAEPAAEAPKPADAKPAPVETMPAKAADAAPPAQPSAPQKDTAQVTPPPAAEPPKPAAESPPPAEAPKAAETPKPAEAPKPAAEATPPPSPEPAPAPAPAPAVTDAKPAEPATPAAETPATPAPAPTPASTPAQPPATDTRDEAKAPPSETKPADPPKPASRFMLFGKPVRTWAIQLQNPDPDVIAKTPYDVVVIEYSRDGSAETAFTREDVAKMKRKPDGSERILIAYMSIGEAEDYRYYWAKRNWSKKANRPSWIMKENPEWLGNYTIKFWNQGWKDIIYDKPDSYLDKLIDAGFDGAYLDKIDITDVLEDYAPKGSSAFAEMVKFVRGISKKANERTGNRFALVASNAEAALDDDDYREVMHAIGKEDLFFNSRFDGKNLIDGFPNDPEAIKEQIRLCKKLVDEKKLVLAVEYLQSKPELIDPTAKKHLALGHIPYFGPRDLARLSGTTYAQAARVTTRESAGAPSLSTSVRKAASCTGLSETACGSDTGCVWMHGYSAGDVDVPGYCRIAPASTVRRLGVEKRE